MAIIDGINVACNHCRAREWYIFRGQDGEGYKFACAKCGEEDRDFNKELNISYLWKHKEVQNEKV